MKLKSNSPFSKLLWKTEHTEYFLYNRTQNRKRNSLAKRGIKLTQVRCRKAIRVNYNKVNSKLIIWFKQRYPQSLRTVLNDYYFRVQNTGLYRKLKR